MVLGFTEDDVKKMDEFLKYVGKNLRKDMDVTEAFRLVSLIQHANQMLRKMNDHIGQLEKLTEPEVPTTKKKTSSRKKNS